jgi:hypothetical protein
MRGVPLSTRRRRAAALSAERLYYAPHWALKPRGRHWPGGTRGIRAGGGGALLARAVLMPAEDFDASAWSPDADLAERFVAPIDHVSARGDECSRGRP